MSNRHDAIRAQLDTAGLTAYLRDVQPHGDAALRGHIRLAAIFKLRGDTRFQEGVWHLLHAEVGEPRTEFRSHRGELAPKSSLQIVINTKTGAFYADIDKHSTEDVVNIFGHLFGEVIFPKIAKLWKKAPPKDAAHG